MAIITVDVPYNGGSLDTGSRDRALCRLDANRFLAVYQQNNPDVIFCQVFQISNISSGTPAVTILTEEMLQLPTELVNILAGTQALRLVRLNDEFACLEGIDSSRVFYHVLKIDPATNRVSFTASSNSGNYDRFLNSPSFQYYDHSGAAFPVGDNVILRIDNNNGDDYAFVLRSVFDPQTELWTSENSQVQSLYQSNYSDLFKVHVTTHRDNANKKSVYISHSQSSSETSFQYKSRYDIATDGTELGSSTAVSATAYSFAPLSLSDDLGDYLMFRPDVNEAHTYINDTYLGKVYFRNSDVSGNTAESAIWSCWLDNDHYFLVTATNPSNVNAPSLGQYRYSIVKYVDPVYSEVSSLTADGSAWLGFNGDTNVAEADRLDRLEIAHDMFEKYDANTILIKGYDPGTVSWKFKILRSS